MVVWVFCFIYIYIYFQFSVKYVYFLIYLKWCFWIIAMWGFALITFLWVFLLTNWKIWLRLLSILIIIIIIIIFIYCNWHISFDLPKKMSTSFFDMIVISSWAEPIYVFTLHLGLVYPIISKLSFSVTFSLPARQHAWLSPGIIIVSSFSCSLNYDFFFLFFHLSVRQLDSSTVP